MFCLIIFTLAFTPSLFFLFRFPHLTPLSHLLALYHSDHMSQKGKLSKHILPCTAVLQLFISALTCENATGKVNPTDLYFSVIYYCVYGFDFFLELWCQQSRSHIS